MIALAGTNVNLENLSRESLGVYPPKREESMRERSAIKRRKLRLDCCANAARLQMLDLREHSVRYLKRQSLSLDKPRVC